MKKKQKGKLIVLFASIAAAFMLGGCSFGESFEEVLAGKELDAQVTYYSNGGEFEGSSNKKDMYYKSGLKALNIGVDSVTNGTAQISRKNYKFGGWYYAVLDEEGNPVYEDEDKKVYKLGDPVDFSKPLEKGDHWIIVAKWISESKVNVMLVCDEGLTITKEVEEGEEAVSYKNGNVVAVRPYDTADKVVNPGDGKAPFKFDDDEYTFVDYYADAACTTPVQWPIQKQDGDVTIYAKYLQGEWDVVRSVKDATNMFNNVKAGKRYWLARNVDLSGKKVAAKTIFDGEIQGNGFTISNLNVIKSKITGGSKVSLFGDIQGTAVIENLTLNNLTFTYSLQSSPVEIYFVFTSLAQGAKITNVKLSGQMEISKAETHIVSNMASGYTHCLFGGYATDAEYLAATNNNGFTVEGDPETYIQIKNL